METKLPGIGHRSAEAALAGILLLIALPLIAFGAALSFAHYRTWPFFVHERVGLGGRRFRLLKVRTLPPSTDHYADKHALRGADVPPIMQVVRRLHFDEFPQLFHVVTGQMTFVGPRPEMPNLHAMLPASFADLRTSVRPGLTCLWQISPHSVGLIGECCDYDRLYVLYRNIRLDLWILARTVLKMTIGRTIRLHQVPGWVIDERRSETVDLTIALTPVVQPKPQLTLVD